MESEKMRTHVPAKVCADVPIVSALTAAGAISSKTMSILAASIARYDDIPCAKKGILNSINSMLRRAIKSEHEHAADAAAEFFAIYFSKKRVVANIHSTVAAIITANKNSRTIVKNFTNAFTDDGFLVEYDNSGGSVGLSGNAPGLKTKIQGFKIIYDSAGSEKNLKRIRSVYGNYHKFTKFFSECGFNVRPIPIVVNKTLQLGMTDSILAEGRIFAIFSFYDQKTSVINLSASAPMYYVVHELSHHLQNRPIRYGKRGQNSRFPPMGLDASLSRESLFPLVISEGGAKFAENLYKVKCKDRRPTIQKNVRSMADDAECFLISVPESAGIKQAEFIKGRYTEFLKVLDIIYDGLEKIRSRGNSLEMNLAELLWDTVREYPADRVYGLGLAMASLAYAVNGYNPDKTLHDLIDPEARADLLDKLANTIRFGKCQGVVADLHRMLRRIA